MSINMKFGLIGVMGYIFFTYFVWSGHYYFNYKFRRTGAYGEEEDARAYTSYAH